jgi:hypothetical protein
MRVVFYVLTILVILTATVAAQDAPYRVQVLGGYVNQELKSPVDILVENNSVLNIDGKVNVLNNKRWTFGPAFNFQRNLDGVDEDVNSYFGGGELAFNVGPFAAGGGFFLGTRKTTIDLDYKLVRKYRGFLEFKLGNFVARPLFVETEVKGGLNQYRSHQFGAAAGFQF